MGKGKTVTSGQAGFFCFPQYPQKYFFRRFLSKVLGLYETYVHLVDAVEYTVGLMGEPAEGLRGGDVV